MIEARHVYKVYPNGTEALSDISFDVDKGEFVFIIGASGAGKSTLIKMLIREIIPERGTLKVNGKDIAKMKRREVPYLRRNIGVIFQDFRLLKNHNVFENVAFALKVTGYGAKEISKRVPEVLELVGLGEKLKAKPEELSGGEQQRVSLARALAPQPSMILADEPTGNLDPSTSKEIVGILKDINIRGTTVVMATHAQEIVNTYRQRVIVLDKGSLVMDKAQGGYSYDRP
ncbi:MAG TPA: cell division ATP-binding protein FtsE [Firmicutes bacterium]|nr:cell division ATP-binding protein FtsE [Bacillota bacterium]